MQIMPICLPSAGLPVWFIKQVDVRPRIQLPFSLRVSTGVFYAHVTCAFRGYSYARLAPCDRALGFTCLFSVSRAERGGRGAGRVDAEF